MYIYLLYSGSKNQASAGLLLDISLPAHHHGKENQTLSLHEKPLPRRGAGARATGTALPRQVLEAVVPIQLHVLLLRPLSTSALLRVPKLSGCYL